jgi:L-Lysine epsilon oxidase N-terminal/L-lysine epsilon oxidase C-terminal domain
MISPEDVAAVRVHPGIGIARLGNAPGPDDYFFAADVPGAAPNPTGGFRDDLGRIKRQAALFRIYVTLKSGEIRELTADDADINWRVQIANLKAGWYRFRNAMDLPRNLAIAVGRRNPTVGRDELDYGQLVRTKLDIVPRLQTISGRLHSGCVFDDGLFYGKPVYLGELRTDRDGRLIVLGGRGTSEPVSPDVRLATFANNDGWHDDVSDGPVRATVTIAGANFEAEPGYVIVAPPNFGPGLFGVLTMLDVAREAFYAAGFMSPAVRPSFTADIWPIFDRLTGSQWVNQGIFMVHGYGSPLDARDPAVLTRLAEAGGEQLGFRKAVAALFRSPADPNYRPAALPPFYGDGVDYGLPGIGLPVPTDGLGGLALTGTLYRMLQQWADGDFITDWKGFPTLPLFSSLSPAEQCEALDQAGLYELLGGPFHPGIELTWIMRVPRLWRAAYRLNLIPETTRVRQDYGPELTPQVCLSPDGPVAAAGPGALTRWLGVPWQTDSASCGAAGNYTPTYYLSAPSFWAPRIPNEVLPMAALARLQDNKLSPTQRQKHLTLRRPWYRLIHEQPDQSRRDAMLSEWWRLGIVEPRDLPAIPGLPSRVHVEVPTPRDGPADDPTLAMVMAVEDIGNAPPEATADTFEKAADTTHRAFPPPRFHYRRHQV